MTSTLFMRTAKLSRKNHLTLVLWAILVLVIIGGVAIPAHFTQASCNPLNILCGLKDFATSYVAPLPIIIITAIMAGINILLTVVLLITGLVMNLVISWVTAVPYTPLSMPAGSAITAGWEVMRDLADMALIFVLIAIAIATILNISFAKGNGWQKIFLSFVGVAILINFSPLITGFIIDISNILTNIFFNGAVDGYRMFLGDTGSAGNIFQQIPNAFTNAEANTTVAFSLLLASFIGIILTLIKIAAFVTMTFLLLARVLALWILVILSPVAFVLYILPTTKQHFEKWWNNFLQWAMLPIPLGLFYWLSAKLTQSVDPTTHTGALCGTQNWNIASAGASFSGDFSKIIQGTDLLTHLCEPVIETMAVAFMFVGFFIAFSFSAVGSKMIVAQGTRWGTRIGAGAARLASTRVAAPLAAAGGRQIQRGAGLAGKGLGAGAQRVGAMRVQRMRVLPFQQQRPGPGGAVVGKNVTVAQMLQAAQQKAAKGAQAVGKGVGENFETLGYAYPGAAKAMGAMGGAAKTQAGAAFGEAKKALAPTVVGKAASAIKQATPETALRAAGALPATILDIPPDKIQAWLNNMKKPMPMGEALKQGVGPGIFSGLGQATPQFNPTAFQNAYGAATGLPGGWNMANPEVINALRNMGSQTFEQQMSRMYLLVQNGLGLILNEQRLQDKKLVEDRKKLYGNIALQDPNTFKQLAKKVPEVIKITSETTLKGTLKLTDQDIKNAGGVGNAAQIAVIKSMKAPDFDGPGRIPQDVLEMSIDKIAHYLPSNQSANILANIKRNYAPKLATDFEAKISHKKI